MVLPECCWLPAAPNEERGRGPGSGKIEERRIKSSEPKSDPKQTLVCAPSRASNKFATLAQAINSTKSTAHKSASNSVFIMLKIDVLAPMPRASASAAIMA
jgi:hypothetical protein